MPASAQVIQDVKDGGYKYLGVLKSGGRSNQAKRTEGQDPEGIFQGSQTALYLKKVPTFKLSVTLSNFNRFSKFLNSKKRMKFAIKCVRHYPPYFSHVATLPWEITHSNFLQIFSRYG